MYGSDIVSGRQVFWDKLVQDLEFYDNTCFTKWYSLNEEVKSGKAVLEYEDKADPNPEVYLFTYLQ